MAEASFSPSASVVVLNHKRPHLLGRVLQGITQLDYPTFEVVVVGDQPDLAAFDLPERLTARVRYVHFAEPNICRARNLALGASSGEIIAFCDDDAVPEPDWLRELVRPFQASRTGAVGGLVRAGDGISVEWQGELFDRAAEHYPLDFTGDELIFLASVQVQTGRFAALRGVNSAFRRAALVEIGGFDEAYRYYLDETDAALRLAEAGWATALNRRAEVHHLREQNAVRGGMNKPRNLFEVAASKAYFCRRHMPATVRDEALAVFRTTRLTDLDSFLRLGAMRAAERDQLSAQIEEGIADGLTRKVQTFDVTEPPRDLAAPEPVAPPVYNIAIECGWGFRRVRRMRALAQMLAEAGHRVSYFAFHSGRWTRTVSYLNGVWVHRGGTWRLDHIEDGKRLIRRRDRIDAELRRVFDRRQFNLWIGPASARPEDSFAPLKVPGIEQPLAVVAMDEMTKDVQGIAAKFKAIIDTAQMQLLREAAPGKPQSRHANDENGAHLMKYQNGQQNA